MHMIKSGKGMIVQHKIPTAAIGMPRGFGYAEQSSFASQNEPITLGGYMPQHASPIHTKTCHSVVQPSRILAGIYGLVPGKQDEHLVPSTNYQQIVVSARSDVA